MLIVSAAVFVLELAGAALTNSLALLADAGHVLADLVGMAISLFAIWLAARPASDARTFGYYRAEILAAVVNSVLLFGIAAYVLLEALRRLAGPPNVSSGAMLVLAAAALGGNLFSAWLLHDVQRLSLNLRGAFLEVLSDAAASAAVILAALLIVTTGFTLADPLASALIAILILPRTWRLLREATNVLLEATPHDVEMAHVRRHILETPGVVDAHDLHVWTITSGMNVVSAHVMLRDDADPPTVLRCLAECLREDFDIEHSTFQLETGDHHRIEAFLHR